MKLIVVEDEKIIRTGLLKHVPWQRLGVSEVEAAANGEEALAKTENFRPDIVLSDIRMPGMSGVDLCRKLREKFPEIEIIFSTGYADKEYLKAAIDLHAVGYVEKPVNVKLPDVIDTYVFRSLIQNSNLGMTAAASFYQSVICFATILIVNAIVKHVEEDLALF